MGVEAVGGSMDRQTDVQLGQTSQSDNISRPLRGKARLKQFLPVFREEWTVSKLYDPVVGVSPPERMLDAIWRRRQN